MRRPDLICEFFTSEQLERARERRKPELALATGEQLSFSLKFNPVTKSEYEKRLRTEIKKKGVLK